MEKDKTPSSPTPTAPEPGEKTTNNGETSLASPAGVAPDKKSHRRLVSDIIFLVLLTALVLTLFLSLGEIQTIGQTIMDIGQGENYLWLIGAFFLTMLYFFLWPFPLEIFSRQAGITIDSGDIYLIGCSEHFYNGVTPFATGGQPFQIYGFTKKNVSTAQGTSAILATFVTHMIATNILAIVALCFYPSIVKGLHQLNLDWVQWVALVGYVMNFLVLLFMIALGSSSHLRDALVKIFRFFSKGKLLSKIMAKRIPEFEAYCLNAQIGFKGVFTHKKAFAEALAIRLVTMVVFYLIPYFLIRSVSLPMDSANSDVFNAIVSSAATAYSITAVVWVPTPGGTGGIEYAFAIVIASVSAGKSSLAQAQAVSLLWRLFTYYFLMLVSFVTTAIYQGRTSKGLAAGAKHE
jgi:glycosyltransferase 2 family protein